MSLEDLIQRYVALWNEPDPDRRRAAIRELWTAEAVHVLQPPADLRATAAAIGFDRPVLEARGHEALERRVARAHDEFVAPGTFTFRYRGDGERLHNVVKFRWEMVSTAGHDAAAGSIGRDDNACAGPTAADVAGPTAADVAGPTAANVAGIGLEVLLLAPDGRIAADYQFIEG
jgi:hypothetical protein